MDKLGFPPRDAGLGDDASAGTARGLGKQQLSESVAWTLRERILSGRLRAGEFLRIDAIASELAVSTTPVREGLLLLQSESFVRLIARRGFVVNSFGKDDLRDLFWAQAVLAGELAARAVHHLGPSDLAQLREIQAQQERAVNEGDTERAVRMGHRFHRAINLAARSPRLALLLGGLVRQLPNRFYASIEGQMEDSVAYHPLILDALCLRDAESARTLMHRHVLGGAEQLIAMLERQSGRQDVDGAASPAVLD